ncbi:DUF5937 family protein [Streptomyces sp. NPDC090306]|uniref:DUF5937 family protein n=1 Tax=Streptomyces sp. NPDC090306 TaxID=3365961 RepID=UPI0038241C2E
MSMRIDVTGLPPERVTFAPSPLAELGMSLHVLSDPDHHPGLRGWAASVSAALDRDLADRLSQADFLWRTTFSDVFAPFAGLPGRRAVPGETLAEEMELLDKLSDEQFVHVALEFTCRLDYDMLHPGPLDSPEMRARSLELAAARGSVQEAFARRLLEDPPAVRAWFRELIRDCDEAFFADIWDRVGPQLAADAREKNELLRRRGLARALAAVSTAVSLDERTGVVTVDKLLAGRATTGEGNLALVPTSLGRPHLMVLSRYGWQVTLTYPVTAPAPGSPTVEQLTLRMTALAHPVRMKLCRHLARTPHTTSELAQALGMTPPEISRHLGVLKKAGVIVTRRHGRYVQHQMDLTTVARLGTDFIEGVLR